MPKATFIFHHIFQSFAEIFREPRTFVDFQMIPLFDGYLIL